MRKPNLRFPEFMDEWEEKKLEEMVVRITRKNKNNETDLPLTISSIDGLVDQRTYFNKVVASRDMSGYYLLKNGEFAYNKSYSVGYAYGSIKRLDKYDRGALSTLYICFALNDETNSDFLKKYFDSQKWYKEIYMISAEGARNHGLLNVPTEDFFKIKLHVPKESKEQQKIADFLLKVDEKIANQEAVVSDYEEMKKGLMQKLFDQEIRFKAVGGNTYPEWVEYRIGDIFLERNEKNRIDEHLLSVTIDGGVKRRDEIKGKNNASEDKRNYKRVCINDMVYNTMRMWQGANGISPYNGIVSPAYTVLKAKIKINYNFFSYLFKTKKLVFQFYRNSQGLTSDTWNLKYPHLSTIKILVPCIEEQQKIANCLSAMDRKIETEKKILEDLKEWKKALLQQMFV